MKLKDKVAIITGASRGIGKALALAFAKEGAAVVIAARTEQQKNERLPGTIYETADTIKSAGGRALAIRCDVTKEDDVKAMAAKALETFGRVDVLINNAGLAFPGTLMTSTAKRWNVTMEVNATGTFLCTQAVVPAMKEQGGGSIINTSSGVQESRGGSTGGLAPAYIISKAAIEQFTYMAACELSQYNIAVNCYKPSRGVITEGFEFTFSPDYDRSKWGGPENMIKAAMFLAVQNAKGVTAVVAHDSDFIAWHAL
jgi:citronellol/citronellal dehydrogenase